MRDPTRVPVPRNLLIPLFVFGTLAPLIFDAVYIIDGATLAGYNPTRDAISSLMNGPKGWIQQANFVVLGVLTLGVAAVWRRILRRGVCETWYPIARAVEGVSLIAIGLTLTDPFHTAWLFAIIGAMMAGLFIIARRFWGDPEWHGWVVYSAASAILINVFIALFGIFEHTSQFAGILERVATNLEPLWGLLVLIRLWMGARLMIPAGN